MNKSYFIEDFIYDEESKIYIYPKSFDYEYSDGDEVERRIYEILRNSPDNSSCSDFLKKSIVDWATEYHFSEYRSNLLRHFDFANKNILELGAGCGAITRFLGESSKKVDAVEGSIVRAKCISQRCRELSNVRVFCSDFTNIEFKERYDVVTLIGVAEYSSLTLKTLDPFRDYLLKAKSFLKEDGILILAIENKLGLKYFSGLPEDHTGIPYYGIYGLYNKKTVQTLGKNEIKEKMHEAGFYFCDFYYPFPDYKLPKVVVKESVIQDGSMSISDILLSVKERDYSNNYQMKFETNLVWESLENNKIIDQLANSFLIISSTVKKTTDSNLVYYYTMDRKRKYNTKTVFKKDKDSIKVGKELITPNMENPKKNDQGFVLNHNLKNGNYINGINLHRIILKNILSRDLRALQSSIATWVEFLIKNGIEKRNEQDILLSIVKKDYFDCLPFNLISTESGMFLIDHEWELNKSTTVYVILLRYIKLVELRIKKHFLKKIFLLKKKNSKRILKLLNLPVYNDQINQFEKLYKDINLQLYDNYSKTPYYNQRRGILDKLKKLLKNCISEL